MTITDNGGGIAKEDFESVCERHCTSKITNFEDLENCKTFGFRGEALASISHVAHLQITSCQKGNPVAFTCKFEDGKMIGTPKPCAGTTGTTIQVEDLFYNTTRRKNFTQHNSEYKKILDLLKKYALKNPTVNFVCKNVSIFCFVFFFSSFAINF